MGGVGGAAAVARQEDGSALLEGLEPGQRPQISDIRYGAWSRKTGLKRGPLFPSDDFLLMEAMGTRVYEHLLEVADQLRVWFLAGFVGCSILIRRT